jgi:hypothetical protein
MRRGMQLMHEKHWTVCVLDEERIAVGLNKLERSELIRSGPRENPGNSLSLQPPPNSQSWLSNSLPSTTRNRSKQSNT